MEKTINLQEAKEIIEQLEELENSQSDVNILQILPDLYRGYDRYRMTNFLLQMTIKDSHYYMFIENELNNIEELDKFTGKMENDKILLQHKKMGNRHRTWYRESVGIDFQNKTYTLKYIDDARNTYEGLTKATEPSEKSVDSKEFAELMGTVGEYVNNPTLKNKLAISKLSGKNKVSNFIVSKDKLKDLYEKYTKEQEYHKEHNEEMVQNRLELKEWYDTVFQEIVADCNEVVKYLETIGYKEEVKEQ